MRAGRVYDVYSRKTVASTNANSIYERTHTNLLPALQHRTSTSSRTARQRKKRNIMIFVHNLFDGIAMRVCARRFHHMVLNKTHVAFVFFCFCCRERSRATVKIFFVWNIYNLLAHRVFVLVWIISQLVFFLSQIIMMCKALTKCNMCVLLTHLKRFEFAPFKLYFHQNILVRTMWK